MRDAPNEVHEDEVFTLNDNTYQAKKVIPSLCRGCVASFSKANMKDTPAKNEAHMIENRELCRALPPCNHLIFIKVTS